MDEYERIKKMREITGLSQERFADRYGLKKSQINNIENKKQAVPYEVLKTLGKEFPEFKIWIMTGDEFPEAGQISPMTKKEADNQKVS
ncbi:Helix-turn-helix domain-containing protein [uncultured Thiomicrorhabdus sp.]